MTVGRWELDQRGLISGCPQCGQRNRISYEHLGGEFRCGRCKRELGAPAEPVDIPGPDQYDALLDKSALPVVVDYWAEWCGPCRAVAPELAKVAAANAGRLIVAKLDTERLPAVAERLRIQSIPMLTVSSGGRERGRSVGARPARDIQAFVDDALARR